MLVTIALFIFLLGTIITLMRKSPIFIWSCFSLAYIFLLIGIPLSFPNTLIMGIVEALNIYGLVKSIKKREKNENV